MTLHSRGGRLVALGSGLVVLSIFFASAPALIAAEEPAITRRAAEELDRARSMLIQQAQKARKKLPRVEVLSPAGVCGDGLPDPGEECDDGNTAPGDGCSASCLVEPGWQCSPAGQGNAVADGSLEAGSPNPFWTETGEELTPICSESSCGFDLASDGDWYAWFGGIALPNLQTMSQVLTIPTFVTELRFELFVAFCDSASDYVKVQIDGNDVFTGFCTATTGGYVTRTIDLTTAPGGPYNDGGSHTLRFEGDTFVVNADLSNQWVDEIRMPFTLSPPEPSVCGLAPEVCFTEEFEGGLGAWTRVNSGGLDWGTTDDGFCGSDNWTAGNYTDGAGVAACVDSDAGGPALGQVESFLCSPEFDFSAAVGLSMDFLYNYQIYQTPGDDDYFAVLVGDVAPTIGTVALYDLLFATFSERGFFEGSGDSESLSLSAYDGQGSTWICFGYGAHYDWYAQVDNFQVSASTTCEGTNVPEEASPPGAVVPLTVAHTAGGPEVGTLDLAWVLTPGAETYRIISGDLATLQPSGAVTAGNAAPVICGVVGLSTSIPEPAGSVFLLVAGENAIGIGPLGDPTDGPPRAAATACP